MNRRAKNILIVFFIGTLIFIVGSAFFKRFQYEGFNDFMEDFLIYQLYAFVLGYSNMTFFQYMETIKWPEGSTAKRIASGIIGSTVLSVFGLFLIRMSVAVFYQGLSFAEYWNYERIENFYFGIWATTSVIVVVHVIYFYNRYQKTKVKESQIVAKNETAKFESLKNQLDPHFYLIA